MEIWQKLEIGSIICQPGPKVCMTFYKGPPFEFLVLLGDPYKMSNINVVQSCWNFAQLSRPKNKQVAKIWGL